jgi:uncharacterized protein YceK
MKRFSYLFIVVVILTSGCSTASRDNSGRDNERYGETQVEQYKTKAEELKAAAERLPKCIRGNNINY